MYRRGRRGWHGLDLEVLQSQRNLKKGHDMTIEPITKALNVACNKRYVLVYGIDPYLYSE